MALRLRLNAAPNDSSLTGPAAGFFKSLGLNLGLGLDLDLSTLLPLPSLVFTVRDFVAEPLPPLVFTVREPEVILEGLSFLSSLTFNVETTPIAVPESKDFLFKVLESVKRGGEQVEI